MAKLARTAPDVTKLRGRAFFSFTCRPGQLARWLVWRFQGTFGRRDEVTMCEAHNGA